MLYAAVFAKNLKQQLMYRSEFVLSAVGSLLFVYVQVAIWRALLGQGAVDTPFTLNIMVAYIIAAFVLRRASRTYFPRAYAEKVNRGDIAIDLVRPVNVKNMMLSEQASENLCVVVFSCVPVAIISGFVWGFQLMAGPALLGLFVVSFFLAIALRFYVEYIFGMLVFWVRSEVYPRQLCEGLMLVFSGAAVPLWFYPDWLRAIGMFLPFGLMAFEPIQIFLATVSVGGALMILARQVLWLGILWLIERFVWGRIKNNVFVQGG